MSETSGGQRDETAPHGDRDPAAEFATRFRSSFGTLWLIALGIVGNRTDAEDVVQEAAVVALTKMDQFEPGTNFTAWLSQIIRNVARNQARRERKRRMISLEANSALSAGRGGPVDHRVAGASGEGGAGGGKTFDARLMEALRNVNDVARACLLMRTLEGMEYSKIAELLEIPPGTAMSHVHRTRRYLRERLQSYSPERE